MSGNMLEKVSISDIQSMSIINFWYVYIYMVIHLIFVSKSFWGVSHEIRNHVVRPWHGTHCGAFCLIDSYRFNAWEIRSWSGVRWSMRDTVLDTFHGFFKASNEACAAKYHVKYHKISCKHLSKPLLRFPTNHGFLVIPNETIGLCFNGQLHDEILRGFTMVI
jgi:hypothetical protein